MPVLQEMLLHRVPAAISPVNAIWRGESGMSSNCRSRVTRLEESFARWGIARSQRGPATVARNLMILSSVVQFSAKVGFENSLGGVDKLTGPQAN
jgi:hypothetical protein